MKPNNLVLTKMAALCWKLNEDQRFNSVVEEARELHQEWAILNSRYASAGYTAGLNRQMESEALVERMVALMEKSLEL